ncbi:protein-methionine-sulfoxide reductase heme-binding subunit MsrQ [Oleomonas cavernae]|uniref:sulfite oxidase heme-binding subunit YedZ n=1 Tax=Oleomonas cavernae TaxID=2320859 RepID=UPI0038D07F7B
MSNISWPWNDRRGRLSALKLAVFIGLFLPGGVLAVQWANGDLMPRPLNAVIHGTGLWGIRFLMISLVLTPLRQGLAWPSLILVRRMVGVAAFAYIATHFMLFVGDQAFDLGLVVAEIVKRFYLLLGFIALLGLSALAATSTDGMVRRLGPARWRALHRLVYGIAILGIVHYFMQSKVDPGQATVVAGLYLWAMARRRLTSLGLTRLPLMVVVAALGAALAEASFFWALRGVDPLLVLASNLDVGYGPRPALIAGLIVVAVEIAALIRRALKPGRAARPGRDAPRPDGSRPAESVP